tara:strand:- start:13 stop:507 length:495 start_codon:yes stop_codon:yes gene_type:complete
MSNFCPDWIFNLCSGMIATEFISKTTTIPALSLKYTEEISSEYDKIDPALFEEVAEQYILMLNELEVGEESFNYLTGFCCYKINFVNPKTKRNLTGLFSKELKGTASPEYNINNAKKAFKAYIFAMRSGQMQLAPPGWTIEKDISIELLKDVAAKDVGIESLFS